MFNTKPQLTQDGSGTTFPPAARAYTEGFSRSERIPVSITVGQRELSGVALVSELREADPASPSVLAVWLVAANSADDAPIQKLADSDKKILKALRLTLESQRNFRPVSMFTMKGLPHPERYDESISILLQALPDISDAYGAVVRAVRYHSDSQRLSLGEHASDGPQAFPPTSTSLFQSDPRARIISALIEMDYAAAATLLRLEERLPKPHEATKFSVAALVSRYLKENGLTALEGRAMLLVNDIWPQPESSQV